MSLDYLLSHARFEAHLPKDDHDVLLPLVHADRFSVSLETSGSFFTEWCMYVTNRKTSHQIAAVAACFRKMVITPLNATILRLLSKEEENNGKMQAECDAWREALPCLFNLAKICLECVDEGEHGNINGNINIMDSIYEDWKRAPRESLQYRILAQCWRETMQVLASQVRGAIFDGLIDDHYAEFFIYDRIKKHAGGAKSIPFQRYAIDEDKLPKFITQETARGILFVVHTTDCGMQLQKDTSRRNNNNREPMLSEMEILETFQKMAHNPRHAQLVLEGDTLKWRNKVSKCLSEYVPLNKIRSGLHTIRALLLLGNELFWGAFFREARERYDVTFRFKYGDKDAELVLNSILGSVYTEHGEKLRYRLHKDMEHAAEIDIDEDDSIPLSVFISKDGSVWPRYALSDVESIMLAPAAPVYCDMFNISFSVRRVSFELNYAYQALKSYARKNIPMNNHGEQLDPEDLRKQSFVRCMLLIRSRMAIVINSIDWFIQCGVVQPKIEKLDALLSDGTHDFEKFLRQQHINTKEMTAQCMLSDTIVTERYQQIFDTTLAFCAAVQNSDNQSIDVEEVFEEAFEQEKIFSRNVHLFTLLLQKNDNASKIHHPAKTELLHRLQQTSTFRFSSNSIDQLVLRANDAIAY